MRKFLILLTLLTFITGTIGISKSTEDNLRLLIEEFEGIKLKAYRCPKGVPTIGIGSTRYEDGSRVKLGDEISLDYAEVLYEREVDKVRKEVDQLVIPNLNKNQEDALVSFAYNVGINACSNLSIVGTESINFFNEDKLSLTFTSLKSNDTSLSLILYL